MTSSTRALFSTLALVLAVILATIALSGCVHQRARATALPPLVTYSPKFQKELLAEQPKIRDCCPRAETVIKDYSKLRDMIRAGKAKQR
jgi:hypothetical protein